MSSPARVSDGDVAARPIDSLEVGEIIYPRLDPLDPRKISLDIFELYCQEMLMTTFVGRRAFLINKMRYMMRRLIGSQYEYGRLYNRSYMANIVARVCGRHAYLVPEAEEIEEGDQHHQLPGCLVDFTPERWSKVIIQFEDLNWSMLRNDASLLVLPEELSDENERSKGGDSEEPIPEPDDKINKELASHADFSKGYAKMLDSMKFHMCLSHLQPQLETAIQNGSIEGVESVVIPHDNIVAFDSAIEEQFGDDKDNKYARILDDLLEVNKKITRPTRNGGLHLKSFSEIKQIHTAHYREFDLERFQDKFLRLIRRWTDLVLPVPELSKLNYGSTVACDDDTRKPMATEEDEEDVHALGADIGKTPSSFAASPDGRQQQDAREDGEDGKHSPAASDTLFENEVGDDLESSSQDEKEEKLGAMEDLSRKRKALTKKVKDPLENCVEIAQTARTRQKSDESSENEDESGREDSKAVKSPSFCKPKKSAHRLKFDSDDSEEEGVVLSEVPARYKAARRVEAPRKIHVDPRFSPSKKRVPFNESEDWAIRSGVEEFGAGKWKQIKDEYAIDLKDRTTVQIKDRWRTLGKQSYQREG